MIGKHSWSWVKVHGLHFKKIINYKQAADKLARNGRKLVKHKHVSIKLGCVDIVGSATSPSFSYINAFFKQC